MIKNRALKPVTGGLIFSHVFRSFMISIPLTFASLALGVAGYHYTANMPWIDALLNASMILGGMGPVDTLTNTEAKLFASFYALYSGLFILACMGIMLSPVVHLVLHAFHAED